MVHCVVIARNGYGHAWRFFDRKAARLHPIPQMDDVYASSGEELVEQYGRGLINDLLRFAEGKDRVRLAEAFDDWKGGGPLSTDAIKLLWSVVYSSAATPPDSPTELIQIIKEDRLFREGRVLRSIGMEERSSANSTSTRKRKEITMSDATRKRVDENSTITVLTDEGKNPKRAGSKAYDRFALYVDGMTVKEAKAAGVTASDIAYDATHSYISLTPGEPVAEEEGEEGEAEEAPKKKRTRAA